MNNVAKIRHDQKSKDEPDQAYKAYEIFRNLGKDRTFAQASFLSNLSQRTMFNYSAKWNWNERVKQYDKIEANKKAKNIRDIYSTLISYRSEQNISIKMQIMKLNKLLLDEIENNPQCLEDLDFQRKLKNIEQFTTILNKNHHISEISREEINLLKDVGSSDAATQIRERIDADPELAMMARNLIGSIYAEEYDDEEEE
ncbi:MAG: hypothetical protein NT007_16095 [Candidatus Kapabacteria bacterium]|nr:hypothetical protein [Candidatus Kapabacteria bacterium]